MNLQTLITDGRNLDFLRLISFLDSDLDERYGTLQKQYKKHNTVENIKDVIILYDENIPVACGAFRVCDSNSVELKRVFVLKEFRRQGLAKMIIEKLEELAELKGYGIVVLETGIKQLEAINLYKKLGYEVFPNFAPYIGNENSICMKKAL